MKVWEHETLEKIWCEEIDLGEEKVRTIASGLRHAYTADQMLNRKVVVCANLKPRNIKGRVKFS